MPKNNPVINPTVVFAKSCYYTLVKRNIIFNNFTFIKLWNNLQRLPPMDIAIWAFITFILLVVVRRNIGFFEISFFHFRVAYGTFNLIHRFLF